MKVLLLHAWPLDERMWGPQLPLVENAGFEPVAPRLYGRGASIEQWAVQLLGELEGPLVAVGASMGGYCALQLARRAPERVPGLVLAGSRAAADSPERRLAREQQIVRLCGAGPPPDAAPGVSVEEHAVAQAAMRDRPDASGVVASFGGPLLLCAGDRDEFVPLDEARELAASALLGRLEVFEGAGHFLTVEQPDRFGALLVDFLSQWT